MGRHWSERSYISAEVLWEMIDTLSTRMAMMADENEPSELYKLFVAGRRDMLESMSQYVHDTEVTLGELLVDGGIMSREDINKDRGFL